MFSRFFTTISSSVSSVTSPKAMLSEMIAKALNVYFVIDPQLIESNLLSDTKIVLRNILLKPLPLLPTTGSENLILLGVVNEIEFKWTWGSASDGSTSFVHETMLTIKGAKFRIIVGANSDATTMSTMDDTMDDEFVSITASDATESNMEDDKNETYIQKYLQQILDHLTLIITDMEISIDVGNSNLFVMNASDIQLMSFGHSNDDDVTPVLTQRFSLGFVRGDVIQTTLPSETTSDANSNGSKILPCFVMHGFRHDSAYRRETFCWECLEWFTSAWWNNGI